MTYNELYMTYPKGIDDCANYCRDDIISQDSKGSGQRFLSTTVRILFRSVSFRGKVFIDTGNFLRKDSEFSKEISSEGIYPLRNESGYFGCSLF